MEQHLDGGDVLADVSVPVRLINAGLSPTNGA
jgi:hypothetical protein